MQGKLLLIIISICVSGPAVTEEAVVLLSLAAAGQPRCPGWPASYWPEKVTLDHCVWASPSLSWPVFPGQQIHSHNVSRVHRHRALFCQNISYQSFM